MDGHCEAGAGVVATESEGSPGADQHQRQKDKSPLRKNLKIAKLPPFFTIGAAEKANVIRALKQPLSGYLGGISRGGYWVERLADEWCDAFGAQYAIPCNSATSGLLAACMAAGIGEGDLVLVSDYTMSASATCALMLGARVKFMDIEDNTFNAISIDSVTEMPTAIIITNLFGHPARLHYLRQLCDKAGVTLIEDNAQAPFAKEYDKFAGAIGHIGVFSLNVHKHIQCGEGGIIVTSDAQLAHKVDCAINHGELMKADPHLGLNLRMTEPIAAIASAQLKRGKDVVQTRIGLAETLSDFFHEVPFVEPPQKREECVHVYYMWAGKIKHRRAAAVRNTFISRLQQRGVPFRGGYSVPLHRLLGNPSGPDPDADYPVTCAMADGNLFTFEICAYDPTMVHLRKMNAIIQLEADKIIKEYGCED